MQNEIIYEEYTPTPHSAMEENLPSETVKEMQRKRIIAILEKHQGKRNIRDIIANEIGLSPSTVWRRLKEYRDHGYLTEEQVLL